MGNWNDAASAVDACLPIAHLLSIVPYQLMWALLGVVNAGQAVVINVAKLRISKVAVSSQRAFQRTVDDLGAWSRVVVVVHVVAADWHMSMVKVHWNTFAAVDLVFHFTLLSCLGEQVALWTQEWLVDTVAAHVEQVAVNLVSSVAVAVVAAVSGDQIDWSVLVLNLMLLLLDGDLGLVLD